MSLADADGAKLLHVEVETVYRYHNIIPTVSVYNNS